MRELHIDIETFSSIPIQDAGLYKYSASIDFEILMIAYAFDDEPIKIVSLAEGETLPYEFVTALQNPDVKKFAHNAVFERICFKAYGWSKLQTSQWYCTAIMSAYCGLPLSLGQVSQALSLGDKAKLTEGRALIRYFSIPCKPTKKNGQRERNFWFHDLEKWERFKEYCKQDVAAEREIHRRLKKYPINDWERSNYLLDQKINDGGIEIDTDFAAKATRLDREHSFNLLAEIKKITGLDNPNSPAQLKKWVSEELGKNVKSLAKGELPTIIEEAGEGSSVARVLKLRMKASKTSTKKYPAMLDCVGDDNKARGLLQFYGASRTGRWAGRLVQLQNLPQNHLDDLDGARSAVKSGDYDLFTMLYENVSSTLSQLVRTAFIAGEGKTFAVADFSAIEARVIAWIAGEQWRIDVFNDHGKIYEASASMMFDLPFEQCTKEANNGVRAKGKVAELALGYQGAIGALTTMGGEKMGLSREEMKEIVEKWRAANPSIVNLWKRLEAKAMRAIRSRKTVDTGFKGVKFHYNGELLAMELPSGRRLHYWGAQIYSKTTVNNGRPWTRDAIRYKGMHQQTRQWTWVDTYGGKLTENLIQAIARDLLADCMLRLDAAGFDLAMHVHDEALARVAIEDGPVELRRMERLMSIGPKWAEGLPLAADGYLTSYYKKD